MAWRGSLGVRDSESCWFTEEIGTYLRCWESPGDLPLVIEILFLFARFAPLHSRKDIKFLSLVEDHPVFPKNVCKNLLDLLQLQGNTAKAREVLSLLAKSNRPVLLPLRNVLIKAGHSDLLKYV